MNIIRSRNYQYFLSSIIISSLGSFAFNFAFMTYLYFETGQDKRFIALSQLFFIVGMLLGNITGGPIGEKINRKKLLVFGETIRVPIVAVMLIYSNDIWPLLFLNGFKSYFAGIAAPLKRTFITDTISKKDIASANSLYTIAYSLTQITGPLIGTWIYFYVKKLDVLIWIDLITFAISAMIISKLKYPQPKIVHKKISIFKDMLAALKYIHTQSHLSSLFEKHLVVGIISGFLMPLILPFTIEVLKLTEKEYGVMMLLFGLGGLLGSVYSKKLCTYYGTGKLIVIICMIEPFVMLIMMWAIHPIACFLIFTFWGALFFMRITAQLNYLSIYTSKDYLSRTNSLFDFVFTFTNITSSTLISLIGGKQFSTQQFLLIVGLIYLVFTVIRFFTKNNYSLIHFTKK